MTTTRHPLSVVVLLVALMWFLPSCTGNKSMNSVGMEVYRVDPDVYSAWSSHTDAPKDPYGAIVTCLQQQDGVISRVTLIDENEKRFVRDVLDRVNKDCEYKSGFRPEFVVATRGESGSVMYYLLCFQCHTAVVIKQNSSSFGIVPFCHDPLMEERVKAIFLE